jgi:hypothetical protein
MTILDFSAGPGAIYEWSRSLEFLIRSRYALLATLAIGLARYVSRHGAARFFDRSIGTVTFKRGMNAYNNPGFYRQLGKDPEQLTQACVGIVG